MKTYDHIIIGTGQASGVLLGKLTEKGFSVAVIEKHKVGGSCVNYGCTPTKTLVASAKAFHKARQGSEYGFTAKPKLDFRKVMQRMNGIRNASNKGMEDWLESEGKITFYRGEANFISDKQIEINGEQITAQYLHINVGTKAYAPPIEGLSSVPWMDSERLLELEELPEHLIIIGGGYIGVEFSQVFKRFGSRVTLIQSSGQLMPKEDQDVAKSVQDVLENEGVEVLLNSKAEAVEKTGEGLELTLKGGGRKITGSHLLVAIGRKPNSDTLALENTSIETEKKGYVKVDSHCQTTVEGVFALGDVNGQGAFTHTAVYDGETVLDFLFGGNRTITERVIVYGLFTDPPLGRVGLSEKEALDKGHKIMRGTMPMSDISRAKEMGETQGFAKLIVDAETDLILGAAIHGPGGDEIINMFAAIIHSNIPCKRYREVMLVHPTVSELMPYVLDGLEPVE